SRPIDPTTITGTSFTLTPRGAGLQVSGALAVAASHLQATFTPGQPLQVGTTYDVLLTAEIRDQAGTPLPQHAWSFVVDYAWGMPATVATNVYGAVAAPAVAVNAGGAAVVGWPGFNGVVYRTYVKIQAERGLWSQLLDGGGAPTGGVDVAIADNGEVVAIWIESREAGTIPVAAHTFVHPAV